MQVNKRNLVRYIAIVGVHLAVTPYAFVWFYGNLATYLDSYFNMECYPVCKDADPQWILPMYVGNSALGVLLLAPLSKLISIRACGLITLATNFISFLGAAWIFDTSVIGTTVLLGGLFAISSGMTVGVCLAYVNAWVPDNAAFFTATVTGFTGLFSVVINQIITLYVNPSNLKPNMLQGAKAYFSQSEILHSVRGVIILLGFINFVLQLFGYLMLILPSKLFSRQVHEQNINGGRVSEAGRDDSSTDLHDPSLDEMVIEKDSSNLITDESKCQAHLYNGKRLQSYGSNVSKLKTENFNEGPRSISKDETTATDRFTTESQLDIPLHFEDRRSWTPMEAIQTSALWSTWGYSLAILFSLVVLNGSYKQFGLVYIPDDTFMATIGSLFPFLSSASRIACGIILDKKLLSVKDVLVLSVAMNSFLNFFWFFCARIDKYLYLIVVGSLATVQGIFYVAVPTVAFRIFGPDHFPMNYGMLLTSVMLIGYTEGPIITLIVDNLGWFSLFSLAGILSAVSLVTIVLTNFDIA